jgi:hypothetical protein
MAQKPPRPSGTPPMEGNIARHLAFFESEISAMSIPKYNAIARSADQEV